MTIQRLSTATVIRCDGRVLQRPSAATVIHCDGHLLQRSIYLLQWSFTATATHCNGHPLQRSSNAIVGHVIYRNDHSLQRPFTATAIHCNGHPLRRARLPTATAIHGDGTMVNHCDDHSLEHPSTATVIHYSPRRPGYLLQRSFTAMVQRVGTDHRTDWKVPVQQWKDMEGILYQIYSSYLFYRPSGGEELNNGFHYFFPRFLFSFVAVAYSQNV